MQRVDRTHHTSRSLLAIVRLDVAEINTLLLPHDIHVRARCVARKLVRQHASYAIMRYFVYHCLLRQLDILFASPSPRDAVVRQIYGLARSCAKHASRTVRARVASYSARVRNADIVDTKTDSALPG